MYEFTFHKSVPEIFHAPLKKAEAHLNAQSVDPIYQTMIMRAYPYRDSTKTANEIIRDILDTNTKVEIKRLYIPWYRRWWKRNVSRRKTRAKARPGRFTIWLNFKLPWTDEDFMEYLRHEICHIYYYFHKGQKRQGERYMNSVPVQLGVMGREHYKRYMK